MRMILATAFQNLMSVLDLTIYDFFCKTYVFLHWVSPELPSKDVKDFLPHPPAFGKSGEGEIVRVHFAESCKKHKVSLSNLFHHWSKPSWEGYQLMLCLVQFWIECK